MKCLNARLLSKYLNLLQKQRRVVVAEAHTFIKRIITGGEMW